MDYEKKYKELVGKIGKAYLFAQTNSTKAVLEEIYPELKESKESEDEKIIDRIKKAVIYYWSDEPLDEILAWLEKQGEHANFRNNIQIGDKVTRNEDGVLVNLSQLNRVAKKDEKQGEQKSNDKVEFEIGDLITNGILVGKIDEIHELGYHAYFGDHYADIPDVENWHKWTIRDAKDGDVLSYRDGQWIFIYKGIVAEDTFKYYALLSEKGITVNDAAFSLLSFCITPATKEQRDKLEKAMFDAGYTFDFDKKELKKTKQKPAWSEEDEKQARQIERIVHDDGCTQKLQKQIADWLKSLKDRVQPKQELSEEDEKKLNTLIGYIISKNELGLKYADWLKSLKERVQPKQEWSEEMGKLCLDAISLLRDYASGVDKNSQLGKKIGRADAFLSDLYHDAFYPSTYNMREDLRKSEWSEEDEDILNTIINHFKVDIECTDEDDVVRWLKSLKDRYTWKPSIAQLNALSIVSKGNAPDDIEAIVSLYQDLKKLKGK